MRECDQIAQPHRQANRNLILCTMTRKDGQLWSPALLGREREGGREREREREREKEMWKRNRAREEKFTSTLG